MNCSLCVYVREREGECVCVEDVIENWQSYENFTRSISSFFILFVLQFFFSGVCVFFYPMKWEGSIHHQHNNNNDDRNMKNQHELLIHSCLMPSIRKNTQRGRWWWVDVPFWCAHRGSHAIRISTEMNTRAAFWATFNTLIFQTWYLFPRKSIFYGLYCMYLCIVFVKTHQVNEH